MIFLHNPAHNGDVLASSQLVKLLIIDNPHLEFKIVPSCASILFEDFVKNTPNSELLKHPSPWVFTTNNVNENDYIHKLANTLLHLDGNGNLYLNTWKFMLSSSNVCIDIQNVIPTMNSFVKHINEAYKIGIKFGSHTMDELVPTMPQYDVSFMNTLIDRKKYDKIMFFYNLNGCSGQELAKGFNHFFINKLLNENPNCLLIIVDKCEIEHPNLLTLSHIPKEHSGKSLVLYANICNLCDEVYFKDNGGSLFLLNEVNISNKRVNYFFVGSPIGTYGAIVNGYKLKCNLIHA
jgi:hypothetical protein